MTIKYTRAFTLKFVLASQTDVSSIVVSLLPRCLQSESVLRTPRISVDRFSDGRTVNCKLVHSIDFN